MGAMGKEQVRAVSAAFIQELTRAQLELRLYVVTLVGDPHDAADVLQETNLDLWKKAETYDPARPFLPWAKTLAWYQVLKHRTLRKRDRLIFSEDVLNAMAESLQSTQERGDDLLEALEGCVKKLSDRQRAFLAAKYAERKSVEEMAGLFRHSTTAVASLLYRLRNLLHACVDKQVRLEHV